MGSLMLQAFMCLYCGVQHSKASCLFFARQGRLEWDGGGPRAVKHVYTGVKYAQTEIQFAPTSREHDVQRGGHSATHGAQHCGHITDWMLLLRAGPE